jgi:hypothetical protein
MKPKNIPLFYAGVVTGLLGVWLFAGTLYWLSRETSDVHGANIGAGMLGLLSWLLGGVSLILFILSYTIKPKS